MYWSPAATSALRPHVTHIGYELGQQPLGGNRVNGFAKIMVYLYV